MATDRAKLMRKRVVAAKIETTTGTPISLAGADAAMIVLDPVLDNDDNANEREYPADLGQLASLPGERSGRFTCRCELMGSGATGLPLWATTFLAACDMTVATATYSFGINTTTLTIGMYEDGLYRELSGARGTYKITIEDGKPAYIDFDFRGKYSTPSDVAILSPTFPTVKPPICMGMTISLMGQSGLRMSRIELDAANEVVLREDLTDDTGIYAAAIVDRKPRGTADPEAVSVATKDWYTAFLNSTEATTSIVLGASANNTITITSTSNCQVRRAARGNRNKLLVDQLDLQFNNASPWTIAFS
jgi:hypothetical protein